jgi:PAS domain S-box-containing protein
MAMKLNNIQLYKDILKSSESFQSWINAMPASIIVTSPDKTIEYMNHSATERFGHHTGQPYSTIISDPYDVIEETETTLIDGNNEPVHSIHIRIDGKLYDLKQASLTKTDGTVSTIKILRDITEYKHNEEELKLRALLLDNATDAIFLYDRTGMFYYVNEAAGESWGTVKKTPADKIRGPRCIQNTGCYGGGREKDNKKLYFHRSSTET